MFDLERDNEFESDAGLAFDERLRLGRLNLCPAARRPQFQDGDALREWIVRPPVVVI